MEQEETEKIKSIVNDFEMKIDTLNEEKQLQEDRIATLEYDMGECQDQIQQLQEEIAELKNRLYRRNQD